MQQDGESVDAYVTVLRTLGHTCNFAQLESSLIRDRIVVGLRDNNTRKRLLQTSKLDLKTCLDICRAFESTAQQLKDMSGVHDEPEEVSLVQKKPGDASSRPVLPTPARSQQPAGATSPMISCRYCGRKHEMSRERCPAWGKTCHACGDTNHFIAKCPSKRGGKQKVNAVHEGPEDYIATVDVKDYVGTVSTDRYPKKLHATMVLPGATEVNFQLDCGATVNVLPQSVYATLPRDTGKLETANSTLVMFNKTELTPLGKQRLSVQNPANQHWYSAEFVVVDGSCTPILGAAAIQHMQLITVNKENILKVAETEHSPPSSDIIQQFNDVFTGEGRLEGKLHMEVDRTVKPVQLPVRRVPVAVKDQLKRELDRLDDMNIITKVTEPTDWVSALVVIMKSSGKVRLCIDPKPLNKALKRNHYPMPTIEDILPELPKAKVFSVLDAKNGFWHVELDDESSYLTTFATPWGRYRYLRMPFGVSVAPEEFQRRLHEALEGLDGVRVIADDMLVFGEGATVEEATIDHDRNLTALLERCRAKGVKLNREKVQLRKPEVPYMGHVLSADGLKADPAKVEAIQGMPTPDDKKGVQRLLGMVNYVQKFAPKLSEVTTPLRQLIRDDTEFVWEDAVHGKALNDVKQILSEAPVLRYFDDKLDTVVQCDASEHGLGACLLQEGHPIAYASRSLTETEVAYAQIEKEMLAIVFAMSHFDRYVYGRKVTVESDHKPLESICKKSLQSAPKRLQRMMLRLQRYDFEVQYKRGAEMYLADTLSRASLPLRGSPHKDQEQVLGVAERSPTEREAEYIDMLMFLPVSDQMLARIQKETDADAEMENLKTVIRKGWPETKQEVPANIQDYFPFRDELTLQDRVVLKGDRVVIPPSLRQEMKERVHSSHIGIQGCLRRARESIYWPGMSRELETYMAQCETCNTHAMEQQREPLISHEIPSRPWEKVGCDLFELNGRDYMVTVDYYSNFFEVDRLYNKRGPEVIHKLKSHFARHGIPDTFVSDNGPPFNSREFKTFTDRYEIEHVTSSPGYPRSNGKAENAVKTAKRIMTKALDSGSDPYLALLDWRNTPTEGFDSSPMQRLFGRRTKTLLPTSRRLLKPQTVRGVQAGLYSRKAKQALYYNHGTKELDPLQAGDSVRFRLPGQPGKGTRWSKAKVEAQVDVRSYRVRTENGRLYRRNRKQLRASREPTGLEVPLAYQDIQNNDNVPFVTGPTEEPVGPTADDPPPTPVPSTPPTVLRSGRVSRPPAYLTYFTR